MMEAANQKYHGLAVLEKILQDTTINGGNLLKEMEKRRGQCGLVLQMTERLMTLAKDSVQIKETNPWKVCGAMLSQYVIYAYYLTHQGLIQGIEREEARDFLYRNILKILDGTT